MNKTLLFIIIFCVFTFSLYAQKQSFEYEQTWGEHGYNLELQKADGVEIIYSIESFSLSDIDIKGETMQNINLTGVSLFNDEGMPDLPGSGRMIAIPEGAEAHLNIIDFETEVIKNVNLAPAPKIPLDTEDGDLVYNKNEKVYNTDDAYPANPIKISDLMQIRGVDAVMLGITPFQYNAVTKELTVYKNIRVEVTFQGGSGQFGENKLRSKWWDPTLAQNLINYNSLPKIDYSQRNTSKDAVAEYVILTLNQPVFLQWADSIKNFRRQQGILTDIYTIDDVGGNTVANIESWVDGLYANPDGAPSAILIIADYSTGSDGITSHLYDHPAGYPDYASDNRYADVDNDDLPDIVFARITAQNETHLETMVTKFLNYERTPPNSSDFYNHPISALGWQTERWFQICSETIRGYWDNVLGKNPVAINNIYSGTPGTSWSTATNTASVLNYFGPSGLGYLPASPSDLGGNEYWDNGSAAAVVNAINAGSFMLQHRDHGLYSGWGEPDFQSDDINDLTNIDNELTYILSINCQTGAFHRSSETFAEKFHRHTYNGENSGALGVLAATEVSYSFVNDAYVWGVYDNMWPDFMPDYGTEFPTDFILPAFAGSAGKHFLYQSNWPYNTGDKLVTYRLFHHHGDAFLNVYSEVPQDLTVNTSDVHVFGNLQFNVTVDDGAYVALTYYDNINEETVILATGQSTGGVLNLNMSDCPPVGTNMLLTITKQNYYRFSHDVLVISPDGPYVIAENFFIDDGNNGEADFGETFNLDIALKNVGNQISQGITATLTTTDSYVESLTNAVNVPYSDLDPDEIELSGGNFTVTLTNDVPDQHTVSFELAISDNSTKEVYNSTLSFKVNSPELNIGELSIDDSATGNNDGILDPGETANLIIEISNDGHADVSNIFGAITTTCTYLTINSASTSLTGLNTGESGELIFSVSADAGTPLGTPADIELDVTAGVDNQYSATDSKEIIIGIIPVYLISDQGNVTACTGLFYDSGGESGAYQNDEDYTITFFPSSPNSMVEVNFLSFDVEYNATCGWDWLKIYDGTSTSATLIGMYCGTDSPGLVTASNDDGALTFEFYSDYYISKPGWEAEISCYQTATQGGTLSASNSVICDGSNTEDITLTNYLGTITSWEKRLDGGLWEIISHTEDIYSEIPSEPGTWDYRVEVDNGGAYSNEVSIIVSPETVAGDVSGGYAICEGEETGTLTLSGHTGNVVKWQKQLDGGTWYDISNTSSTYSETPSEDGTWSYCAVVQSGACSDANSGISDVLVNPSAEAGTANSSDDEICIGSTINLTLNGYEGDIQWQSSMDGTTWSNISGATGEDYTTDVINEDIYFRAIVSLGSCPDDESNTVIVSVHEDPLADYTFSANNQEISFTNISTNATDYGWEFGDGNESTEVNPVHTYTASGTYTVVLTASNGVCPDDIYSEDIAVAYVGIEGLEAGSMNIYPNPTDGILYIVTNGFSDYELILTDINGRIIVERKINSKKVELDLSKFPKGIYFMTVKLENETQTGKIILK